MISKLTIIDEEEILIKILFKKEFLKKSDFLHINYDKLVKIVSSHLILPTIYFCLKKNRGIEFIPKDLRKYLYEIYKINRNRNAELLNELSEIILAFKKNNISYIILKGAEYLKCDLYDDLGIRMIGDIDILVEKNDINKSVKILNKSGYKSKTKYKKWISSHLPRFFNNSKLFVLEIHREVIRYEKRILLESKKLFNSYEINKNEYQIIICIMNYQINDYGYLRASYSYRTIYDFFTLYKKNILIDKIIKNKYIRRFFIVTNLLKITNYDINLNFFDKVFIYRFILKKKNKLYNILDNLICDLIIFTPILKKQLLEFIINRKHRNYLINKYFRKEVI